MKRMIFIISFAFALCMFAVGNCNAQYVHKNTFKGTTHVYKTKYVCRGNSCLCTKNLGCMVVGVVSVSVGVVSLMSAGIPYIIKNNIDYYVLAPV